MSMHEALRVAGGTLAQEEERNETEGSNNYLVGANRRLANTRSSMLYPGKQPGRMRVRTYVRTYVLTLLDLLICTKEKVQQGTAPRKNKEIENKCEEEKIPVPFDVIISHLIGTPRAGKKKRTAELLSALYGLLPAPLATTSLSIRSG